MYQPHAIASSSGWVLHCSDVSASCHCKLQRLGVALQGCISPMPLQAPKAGCCIAGMYQPHAIASSSGWVLHCRDVSAPCHCKLQRLGVALQGCVADHISEASVPRDYYLEHCTDSLYCTRADQTVALKLSRVFHINSCSCCQSIACKAVEAWYSRGFAEIS